MTRTAKRILIGLGGLFAVGGATGAYLWTGGGQPHRELEAELARSRALGLPVDPATANTPYPPQAENAAPAFLTLASEIGNWRSTPTNRTASVKAAQVDLRIIQTEWPSLEPFVGRAIELSRYPRMVFQHDYRAGMTDTFPELYAARSIVKLVCQDAVRLARQGDTDAAYERLMAAARITDHLRQSNPTLIQALAISWQRSTVNRHAEFCLAFSHGSPGARKRTLEVLNALGPPIDVKRAIRGEYGYTRAALMQLQDSPALMEGFLGASEGGESPHDNSKWVAFLSQAPAVRDRMYANLYRRMNDFYQQIPDDPLQWEKGHQAGKAIDSALLADATLEGKLAQKILPVFGQIFVTMGRAIAEERLMRCLVAAARDPHAGLPDLGMNSIDPFTGKPFLFVRDGASMRIYSLGPDMRDNGGDTESNLDLVVQYPRPLPPNLTVGAAPSRIQVGTLVPMPHPNGGGKHP